MATLRDLRKRLKAVKSTEKITKAMKMVAASKLKRAQDSILQARPYAMRMSEVLQHIVSRSDLEGHPLLSARVPHRIEVLMVTSDRGLCGSFNSNIIRTAEKFLAESADKYDEIKISKSQSFAHGNMHGMKNKSNFEKALFGVAEEEEGEGEELAAVPGARAQPRRPFLSAGREVHGGPVRSEGEGVSARRAAGRGRASRRSRAVLR